MSDRFPPSDDLAGVVRALDRMAPPFDPPPDLKARVLAAVERAAEDNGATTARSAPRSVEDDPPRTPATARRARVRWAPRRLVLGVAAGIALVAIAFGVGTRMGEQQGPSGPLELAGELRAPRGPATAQLDVRLLGSGREVTITSDSLPILPKGDYYEVWFVAPDGRRISAGTFHPDERGHTDVVLHAAVDPKLFPRVVVTAERGGGGAGPVVLRLRR